MTVALDAGRLAGWQSATDDGWFAVRWLLRDRLQRGPSRGLVAFRPTAAVPTPATY